MNTKRKVKKRHFSDVEIKEKISSDEVKTLCEDQNYCPMVSSSSSKSSLATLNNDTNIKSKLPKPDNKDFENNIEVIFFFYLSIFTQDLQFFHSNSKKIQNNSIINVLKLISNIMKFVRITTL